MVIRFFIIGSLLCTLSGCLPSGLFYTNDVRPVTKNFNKTKVATKSFVLGSRKIEEPFTGYGISGEWGNRSIQAAAKKHGITEIYYIERRRFSILGIFTSYQYIIYGE